MKSWKKLISLALVLVMALSLSLTAFAAPNSGVATISVNNGKTTTVKTVTLTDGMTLYTALNNSFASMNPDWTDAEDYYTPGVYHKALLSLDGKGSTPVGAASGIAAEAWSTKNPGYGLVSVSKDESGTITGYNYVYVGKDWTYKNADGDIWVYMDQYVLQPGDEITITYSQQVSYWTATTPKLSAYPYI
jgi:hypothetical protein